MFGRSPYQLVENMRSQENAFHLSIPCNNLEEAEQFYVGVLGCSKAREYEREIPSWQSFPALFLGEELDFVTNGGEAKEIVEDRIPSPWTITRLYDKDMTITWSTDDILREIGSGTYIINHNGHANKLLQNGDAPCVAHAAATLDRDSLGEAAIDNWGQVRESIREACIACDLKQDNLADITEPAWEFISHGAEETCELCPMKGVKAICRGCPLTEFLVRLEQNIRIRMDERNNGIEK